MNFNIEFLMIITALVTVQADVKHLSKEYLPPSNSLNAVEQSQRNFDEMEMPKIVNNFEENSSKQVEQSMKVTQNQQPFPGPFIGTPVALGGFGFPNAGFQGFPNGFFQPGAVPNFPQQGNFQSFPGSQFPQGFNQPNLGFQQGFPQPVGFNQAFLVPNFGIPLQQFGNQGFPNAGAGFPAFQPSQLVGANFQPPFVPQQPFVTPIGNGVFPQPGFDAPNKPRKSDEEGTIYSSNGGYVYEMP